MEQHGTIAAGRTSALTLQRALNFSTVLPASLAEGPKAIWAQQICRAAGGHAGGQVIGHGDGHGGGHAGGHAGGHTGGHAGGHTGKATGAQFPRRPTRLK
jgi:hypothetical protein